MVREKKAITVLLDLTKALTEKRALEEALKCVTDAAVDLLPGEHASIRILDDSGRQLLSGARSGEGESSRPMSFKPGQGVVGWVAEKGEKARIEDTSKDPRFLKPTQGQGFAIGSMLVVPLWSSGRVVGVLGVTSSQKYTYDESHETMALLLANCAVPPIEHARLKRLAVIDHHTKAFNQRYLFPRLREEIERARRYVTPLSVLLMDLDRFKRVNDTYGHAAGDRVLEEFADRVRDFVRRTDIFVRRGGEEFVLILPQTTQEQAMVAAERIRARIAEEPIRAGYGVEVHQTVSIGVATWSGRETAKDLERLADAGMYGAKRAGRDQVMKAPEDLDG